MNLEVSGCLLITSPPTNSSDQSPSRQSIPSIFYPSSPTSPLNPQFK